MIQSPPSFLFLFLIAELFLSSCGDSQQIKTHRLPKAIPNTNVTAPSQPFLTWKTPVSWKTLAPSAMRRASFSVEDEVGNSLDISIVFLPGDSGSELANVNRWREQIKLPPIDASILEKESQSLTVQIGEAKVIDLQGEESDERTLVATIPENRGTWFIKMTGEKMMLGREKTTFMEFLNSLKR